MEELELGQYGCISGAYKAFSWSTKKVNRDFGAQGFKIEALEVKNNTIPELRTRKPKSQLSARKVNRSQPGPHGQPRRHHTKTHARLSHIH